MCKSRLAAMGAAFALLTLAASVERALQLPRNAVALLSAQGKPTFTLLVSCNHVRQMCCWYVLLHPEILSANLVTS